MAAIDFRFLNFDLLFFFDLLHLHLLSDHLLLHDVGLDVIGFVCLRLLALGDFEELGSFHFEIALRLGLFCQGQRFRQHAILIRLRFGDGSFPSGKSPPDRRVTISFSGSDIGVALDASHVGASHVDDVFVLVADFLDGERDDFQAHLVHVIGASGTHTVADHLRLLDNFFHGQLPDDAAQMTFHDQLDQAFAFLIGLGEELFGGGPDGFGVRLNFDLRDGLDRHRDTLLGVEVLLRRHVKRHQFERQLVAVFHHWEHDRSPAYHYSLRAKSVNNQSFVRPCFSIQPCQTAHEQHENQNAQPNDDPNFNR